jgi:hypothetical protein
VKIKFIFALFAVLFLSNHVFAQPFVKCPNGLVCPTGTVCLEGGTCGRDSGACPMGTETVTNWKGAQVCRSGADIVRCGHGSSCARGQNCALDKSNTSGFDAECVTVVGPMTRQISDPANKALGDPMQCLRIESKGGTAYVVRNICDTAVRAMIRTGQVGGGESIDSVYVSARDTTAIFSPRIAPTVVSAAR